MVKKTIAVLDGDGIGPEIVREALKVLDAVAGRYGHKFTYQHAPFGANAWKSHGHVFPKETQDLCDAADVIIKGPIGDPSIDQLIEDPGLRPERGALLPLRRRYDAFANYRPVVLSTHLEEASPLKRHIIEKGVNILMIRELVGGIYFGDKVEEEFDEEREERYSMDVCEYTENQVARIARVALQEARKRGCVVHNIHKANVLATSRFWNKIVGKVSTEFPDVKVKDWLVDAAAFYLIKNPTQFNGIMLLENMMGDILTDQAAGILGSLGLMPSACWNPETGKGFFEPAHGSAPDIAGQGKANPYSQIGSVAMMLEMSFGRKQESEAVWNALQYVFGSGYRTGEIATENTPKERIISTSTFGNIVAQHIALDRLE